VHAAIRSIRWFSCSPLVLLSLAACASSPSYAIEATANYGYTWIPLPGTDSVPPYPESAKAGGIRGVVAFAVVLNDSGAVDRRTLAVLEASDVRLLDFACPWIERAAFRNASNNLTTPGHRLSAIAIRYSSEANAGRLVQPSRSDWTAVARISDAASMSAYRKVAPQCR